MLLSDVYQAKYSGGPCEVVRFRQEFHKRLDVAVASARLKAHALKVSPDTGRAHVPRRLPSHRVAERRGGRCSPAGRAKTQTVKAPSAPFPVHPRIETPLIIYCSDAKRNEQLFLPKTENLRDQKPGRSRFEQYTRRETPRVEDLRFLVFRGETESVTNRMLCWVVLIWIDRAR